jgi:hypothetical protein
MINGLRQMPLINGVEYGWASITFMIAGVPEFAITAIEFSDKQSVENVYGAGQYPVGRGYGRIEATASITLLKSAVETVRSGSITGRLQDIAPFDIIVCYINQGNAKIIKHVIKNCQFTEEAFSGKEGDISLPTTLPLLPSHILWNA